MKKFPNPLMIAALLLAAPPLTARASSIVYGGVLDFYPGATPYYHNFGTGGPLPYTLSFNYNAPLTVSAFVGVGDITDEGGLYGKEHSAQNMYGYSISAFTNVTMTTEFGSMIFDPNDPYNPADPMDPFSYFRGTPVGAQSADIWFDTDASVSQPTKAIFNMAIWDQVSESNPVWYTNDILSMDGNLEVVLIGEDFPPADPENAFLLVWKEVPLSFVGSDMKSDIDQASFYSTAATTFGAVPEPGGAMLLGLTGAAGLFRRRRRN